MIVPILIGVPIVAAIGAAISLFTNGEEADDEEQAKKRNDEIVKRAAAETQQAKRADAQERQRRQQAQVDRLVSYYGLPISAKSELATWAAAGDAGIKRIERALADGTSDTAKKLRNHDKHRRELLELRDEVLQVSMRAGE